MALDSARIQHDYLERIGWIRANPDEKSYRDEVNPFLRSYFKQIDEHLDRFGGNKQFDDYLLKEEKRTEKKGPRKGPDPKVHYDYVKAMFDRLRSGSYEPSWSASDKGMRLDVLADERANGGKPVIRLTAVLWGAQRSLKDDGKLKRMATSASFDVKWRFTDAQGKLLAEMSATDPSMKIDYPEQFIEEFPPQMVFGHYDVDPVPAEVAKAEITFTVTSRSSTGGEAVASYVWKLDVPPEWKLRPGEKWEGAEESVRPEEEINPAAMKK